MSGELYVVPSADLYGIAPEMVLVGGGVLALLLGSFWPRLQRVALPLGVLSTVLAALVRWHHPTPVESFNGLLAGSAFADGIGWIVLLATFLALLASIGYFRRERLRAAEYTALLLWCAAGVLFMGRATELLTAFVSLELLSICLYALAAYHRRISISLEAGTKYFLMGAFVSAFFLLGIALLYGATGTTHLAGIGVALQDGGSGTLAGAGLLLLLCGLAFKMSLAPFHSWSPDTYQGAPSPLVAFLSVAPKAAAVVLLIRVFSSVTPQLASAERWSGLLALLAVLSMVVGNLFALVQRDIKRMLAYSGVAHMGYLLVPLVEIVPASYEAVTVYLLAYALMNAGAFAAVTLLYRNPGEQHLISDLGGWGYRFPLLGICLTICLLSLAGIPPALGFIGKYLVFVAAFKTGHLWLALAVILTTLIGAFYYLRVVYTLYMRPEVADADGVAADRWAQFAVVLAAAATIALGVLPSGLLRRAAEAAAGLF